MKTNIEDNMKTNIEDNMEEKSIYAMFVKRLSEGKIDSLKAGCYLPIENYEFLSDLL